MVDTEHSTLSGADLHNPKAHDSSHESGGSDEVMINDLNINGDIDVDGHNIYGASDIRAKAGHTIEIQTEDTTRAQMLSDANIYFYRDVNAQPTATHDLGATTYKWKDIWGTTLHGQLADDQTQFLLTDGSRDVAGDLVPDGNNTRHLGTMSRYWNDICVTTVRATTLYGQLADDQTQFLLTNGSRAVTGHILPDTNSLRDLGSPIKVWNHIYSDDFTGGNVNATNLYGTLGASDIAGTLSVSHGGTGVTGDTYDAKYVDGCSTGVAVGNVLKIPSNTAYSVIYTGGTGSLGFLAPGTSGYQLTTQGSGGPPQWAPASDLIWSDTHCPVCNEKFEDGDELSLKITHHNEVGDIGTIPVHTKCTDAYKALEDRISELEA